ncbi:hypothetical protein CHS0354_042204 [Potamilus streckersoni]|uniref:Leucine-rich repeat-containing protein 40 n=1 Tax=Potamilus streckersoni TaxID=2493646 RepID=A0AAE0TNN2_9BIVA|nr:hypothetical protein CHS0354_042204 [Potamilus streckersoni]
MTSKGRRPPANPKAGFRQDKSDKTDAVLATFLKQARQSGQLNLSGRSLSLVPESVWKINIDVPEETKTDFSMDSTEDRWWEQTELTKLILASNCLTSLSEDIAQLPALTVLDVHDNRLESLPDALASLENLQKLDISRNRLTAIPQCVGHIRSLTSLHIEHNSLMELPENIGDLINLEDLDVSYNQMVVLPGSLRYLTHLMRLNVSNNKLRNLPQEIGLLTALRFLDATHNEVTELSTSFGDLRQLEQLYLRHNRLTHLPVLQNCVNLKELHLGNNQLEELTAEHLKHFSSVSVLDVRDNKISVLPDEITLLQGLERLDLTNNNLSGLPYELGSINSLKSIVVDGNPMRSIRRDIIMRGTMELKKYLRSRIEELDQKQNGSTSSGIQKTEGTSGIVGGTGDGINSHEVFQFKSLDYSNKQATQIPNEIFAMAEKAEVRVVNLSKNCLTTVPNGLMLTSDYLKELNLGFNRFSFLHPDISLYLGLTTLDLRNNQLSDLPPEMSSLRQLREIIISFNRLQTIPAVVYELHKLEILFVNDNKIDTINASGLQSLRVLGTLDLQNNNITQVPPELGKCTQLKSLQLGGNPCRNPRPAIIAKGTAAILEYLQSRIVS